MRGPPTTLSAKEGGSGKLDVNPLLTMFRGRFQTNDCLEPNAMQRCGMQSANGGPGVRIVSSNVRERVGSCRVLEVLEVLLGSLKGESLGHPLFSFAAAYC